MLVLGRAAVFILMLPSAAFHRRLRSVRGIGAVSRLRVFVGFLAVPVQFIEPVFEELPEIYLPDMLFIIHRLMLRVSRILSSVKGMI